MKGGRLERGRVDVTEPDLLLGLAGRLVANQHGKFVQVGGLDVFLDLQWGGGRLGGGAA